MRRLSASESLPTTLAAAIDVMNFKLKQHYCVRVCLQIGWLGKLEGGYNDDIMMR